MIPIIARNRLRQAPSFGIFRGPKTAIDAPTKLLSIRSSKTHRFAAAHSRRRFRGARCATLARLPSGIHRPIRPFVYRTMNLSICRRISIYLSIYRRNLSFVHRRWWRDRAVSLVCLFRWGDEWRHCRCVLQALQERGAVRLRMFRRELLGRRLRRSIARRR